MNEARTAVRRVRLAGLSDIGRVRDENQDALLLRSPEGPATLRSRGHVAAVADGMGGLQGGQVASRIATETVDREYYGGGGDPVEVLVEAVRSANRAIWEYSHESGGGQSMGSTLTALVVLGDHACIAQVGDSRAYRLDGGELRQITKDHSLLRELQDRGHEAEDADIFHMHRNVLTRGLGLREDVEVDLYELDDLRDGDVFLLTSDGLHEVVGDARMSEIVREAGDDLDGLCRRLIDEARARGGPDNITAAVVLVGDSGPAEAPASANPDAASNGAGDDPSPPASAAGAILEPAEGGGEDGPGAFFLPLALFLAFLAGVGATLLFESNPTADRPPEGEAQRRLQEARGRLEGILDRLEGATSEEARRAREDLEEIRRVLDEDDGEE